MRDKYVPELDKRMAADGHMVAPYGALRNVNGKREFFMEVFSPRYSHLYSAVQNRPSLLVETPQPEDRANARLGAITTSCATPSTSSAPIRKRCASAVREADKQMAARAGDRSARAGLSGGQSEPLEEPSAGLSRAEERAVQERSDRRHGDPLHWRARRYPDRDPRPDRYHASKRRCRSDT